MKYDQPPVNLRKICKRTVNWPLIYKMYGRFPLNSRFPALFLSQLPITGSVKLRLFFYSVGFTFNIGLRFYVQGAYCQELHLGIMIRYVRFKVRIGLEFKVDLRFRFRFRVYGCGLRFKDYTQIQLDSG